MAGNIQNVNIAQIGEKYAEYSSKLTTLCNDFKKVYSEINNLRAYWTGKRMNAIIEKYNSVSKRMLESVQFFNKTVGPVLLEIRDQYQKMENEGVASNMSGGFIKDFEEIATTIELTSTENVKFEQDKVTSIVASVDGSLDNIGATLATLVNILDELQASSDSLNKLVTSYNSAAETMVSNVTQLKDSLKTEIDNAVKVVQNTESYNDSDAGRVQS